MFRKIFDELVSWKNQSYRKPLIIQGARQVGKTWIMKEFGKLCFEKVVYINFESSVRLQQIFQDDFSITRILSIFEIESGEKITPDDTLIILDEIQEAEKGLTALKYFYENAPDYYIMAAGSLLGISIQQNSTFPVGKVDMLDLYPMSFEEFLINAGEKLLAKALQNREWQIIEPFHDKLIYHLRLFYFVGGMPEAVQMYLNTKDFIKVRKVQSNILSGYENDFAKYAPIEIVPKIRLVWQSILAQLSKENKKFIYGQVKKGARAKEFEAAINWLVNTGLILKSIHVVKPGMPLKSYANFDMFKLYFIDVGLINAMAGMSEKILLDKNKIITEYKGALTEQFVAQELKQNYELYYWTSKSGTSEVDFVLQADQNIVPIEVKAEENLKAKSLRVFEEKYATASAKRFSMSKYREEDWLVNIPLYAVFTL